MSQLGALLSGLIEYVACVVCILAYQSHMRARKRLCFIGH